ncbi:MAG: LysR family transcriptional regulator [Ectothiorhodospiraceae bacterium]|nr:LysR family transcriptional regulator [Ectothiorhodospiraceae bacterium]MCH8505648.1 LysR family transcriptional regulator [Ectothiorhodospiraceae bacterium]
MVDRLTGISVFVEAAESGGFSAAARRLHLSRSAVGKTIARLEARLGVRLFHRTTRTQSLTNEGQAFHERCKRALEEIRAGEAMLESGRNEVAGSLRVTVPALFGRYCVAPVLTDLARKHPGLELELSFNDRNVDLVKERFDLAVRSGISGAGDGLIVRRIARHRMIVCGSSAYLESHGTPRSIADLSTHDMIVYARSGHVRTWVFPRKGGERTEITPRTRLRFDDIEAIADAATAGMGLAWLPWWLIRERVQADKLVPVPLVDGPEYSFDIHALWPQTPHLPYRVRAAVDTLADSLAPLMENEPLRSGAETRSGGADG